MSTVTTHHCSSRSSLDILSRDELGLNCLFIQYGTALRMQGICSTPKTEHPIRISLAEYSLLLKLSAQLGHREDFINILFARS